MYTTYSSQYSGKQNGTLLHYFIDSVEVEDGVVDVKHVDIVQLGHDLPDRLLVQFQGTTDNVLFLLLQVVVVVCHLWKKKQQS